MKCVIEADLRSIFDESEVKDMFCPGKRCSIGKVEFRNPDLMWGFIKANKGTKLKGANAQELWFTVEKSDDERLTAKRTGKALQLVREGTVLNEGKTEEEAKLLSDADWVRGVVWATVDGTSIRIFEKPRTKTDFEVTVEARASPIGLDLDITVAEVNSIQL
jgi:hypothetical protein